MTSAAMPDGPRSTKATTTPPAATPASGSGHGSSDGGTSTTAADAAPAKTGDAKPATSTASSDAKAGAASSSGDAPSSSKSKASAAASDAKAGASTKAAAAQSATSDATAKTSAKQDGGADDVTTSGASAAPNSGEHDGASTASNATSAKSAKSAKPGSNAKVTAADPDGSGSGQGSTGGSGAGADGATTTTADAAAPKAPAGSPAAALDAKYTPEQKAQLQADQDAHVAKQHELAAQSQATKDGEGAGGVVSDFVKWGADKLGADGVVDAIDQQDGTAAVKAEQDAYWSTHDTYVDANGQLYAASYDTKTGDVTLTRDETVAPADKADRDAAATDPTKRPQGYVRSGVLHVDGSGTSTVTAKQVVADPATGGQAYQQTSQTTNVAADGAVTGVDVTVAQDERTADGTTIAASATQHQGPTGTPLTYESSKVTTAADGAKVDHHESGTFTAGGTGLATQTSDDTSSSATGSTTASTRVDSTYAADGKTLAHQDVTDGAGASQQRRSTTFDTQGQPVATAIDHLGHPTEQGVGSEYVVWNADGTVQQRLVARGRVSEGQFATAWNGGSGTPTFPPKDAFDFGAKPDFSQFPDEFRDEAQGRYDQATQASYDSMHGNDTYVSAKTFQHMGADSQAIAWVRPSETNDFGHTGVATYARGGATGTAGNAGGGAYLGSEADSDTAAASATMPRPAAVDPTGAAASASTPAGPKKTDAASLDAGAQPGSPQFQQAQAEQAAYQKQLDGAQSDGERSAISKQYFATHDTWIDTGSDGKQDPVVMAASWSDGDTSAPAGSFGADRVTEPHAVLTRTQVPGQAADGTATASNVVIDVYADGSTDEYTDVATTDGAGGSPKAQSHLAEHYDAQHRRTDAETKTTQHALQQAEGRPPADITTVTRNHYDPATGKPVGEQYSATATSDASATALVETTETYGADGVIDSRVQTQTQMSRDFDRSTTDTLLQQNDAMLAAAGANAFDPNDPKYAQVKTPAVGSYSASTKTTTEFDDAGVPVHQSSDTTSTKVDAALEDDGTWDSNGVTITTTSSHGELGTAGGTTRVIDSAGNPVVDRVTDTTVETSTFDPDDGTAGGNKNAGHQLRSTTTMSLHGVTHADGTSEVLSSTPLDSRRMAEGFDDDWGFTEHSTFTWKGQMATRELLDSVPEARAAFLADLHLEGADTDIQNAVIGQILDDHGDMATIDLAEVKSQDFADDFEDFMDGAGKWIASIGSVVLTVAAFALAPVSGGLSLGLLVGAAALATTSAVKTQLDYDQGGEGVTGWDVGLGWLGAAASVAQVGAATSALRAFGAAGKAAEAGEAGAEAASTGGALASTGGKAWLGAYDNASTGWNAAAGATNAASMVTLPVSISDAASAAADGDFRSLGILGGALLGGPLAGKAVEKAHPTGGTAGAGEHGDVTATTDTGAVTPDPVVATTDPAAAVTDTDVVVTDTTSATTDTAATTAATEPAVTTEPAADTATTVADDAAAVRPAGHPTDPATPTDPRVFVGHADGAPEVAPRATTDAASPQAADHEHPTSVAPSKQGSVDYAPDSDGHVSSVASYGPDGSLVTTRDLPARPQVDDGGAPTPTSGGGTHVGIDEMEAVFPDIRNHLAKHQGDWSKLRDGSPIGLDPGTSYVSASAYYDRAAHFRDVVLGRASDPDIVSYVRGNGQVVAFDTKTSEYFVLGADGTVQTLFVLRNGKPAQGLRVFEEGLRQDVGVLNAGDLADAGVIDHADVPLLIDPRKAKFVRGRQPLELEAGSGDLATTASRDGAAQVTPEPDPAPASDADPSAAVRDEHGHLQPEAKDYPTAAGYQRPPLVDEANVVQGRANLPAGARVRIRDGNALRSDGVLVGYDPATRTVQVSTRDSQRGITYNKVPLSEFLRANPDALRGQYVTYDGHAARITGGEFADRVGIEYRSEGGANIIAEVDPSTIQLPRIDVSLRAPTVDGQIDLARVRGARVILVDHDRVVGTDLDGYGAVAGPARDVLRAQDLVLRATGRAPRGGDAQVVYLNDPAAIGKTAFAWSATDAIHFPPRFSHGFDEFSPGVSVHEWGHRWLDSQLPDALLRTPEGSGIHEAVADWVALALGHGDDLRQIGRDPRAPGSAGTIRTWAEYVAREQAGESIDPHASASIVSGPLHAISTAIEHAFPGRGDVISVQLVERAAQLLRDAHLPTNTPVEFADFGAALQQAAIDLFGGGSQLSRVVQAALDDAGIGPQTTSVAEQVATRPR